MTFDILTVVWKEKKALFRQQSSRTRAAFTFLVPVAVFGVLMPWQQGHGWVEGYWSLATSVFVPLLAVSVIIAESVAGERERHTLETLLASRLPDKAILLGKIGFAAAFGWSMTLIVLLLGLMVANASRWDGSIVFFVPVVGVANLLVPLLLAAIQAGLGVLVSLRASTAQAAAQTLSAATLFPLLLLGVVFTSLLSLKGDLARRIIDSVGSLDPTTVLIIALAVLVLACGTLLWAVGRRFTRQRLFLS